MRLSDLTHQLEEMYIRLLHQAELGQDPDPEIVVENLWGKTQCGTVKVSGILNVRTINNQIVLTLDH